MTEIDSDRSLRQVLGWAPSISLRKGLEMTAPWIVVQASRLAYPCACAFVSPCACAFVLVALCRLLVPSFRSARVGHGLVVAYEGCDGPDG